MKMSDNSDEKNGSCLGDDERIRKEDKTLKKRSMKDSHEKLSVHYLKSIIRENDNMLICDLLENEVGFRKLFDSSIRYEQMPIIFDFISRLCSLEKEESKEVFLTIILSSDEFYRNILGFTENIIEFSQTHSQLLANLEIMNNFFKAVVNYIPISNELLSNYTILLSKSLDISLEINDLPKKTIQNFYDVKEILFKKIDMHSEQLITYQSISVFPTFDEIFNEKPINLRNNVKGPYVNVSAYIDTQFKLLKEDYVSGLRAGIKQYLKEIEFGERLSFNHDIFVYKNVEYIGFSADDNPNKKVLHTFTLDSKSLKKVNWETSKRLIHGSLLIFSCDNFKTLFLGLLDNYKLLDTGNFSISVEQVGRTFKIKKCLKLVMIESKVLFEPYYQVCNTLKSMHPQFFPMCKYIIFTDIEYKPPKYLKNDSRLIISDYEVSLNVPESWPVGDKIGLNKSQVIALQAALTREFVLIQGPPGTGKTYLGIKLINILLDNKDQWSDGCTPIFLACYRNSSVDQILEALVSKKSERPRKVVRLGNRSKSEMLKDCTLKNTVGHRRDRSMYLILNNLKEKLKLIKENISLYEKVKLFILEKQGILKYEVFGNALSYEQKVFFSYPNAYENWLLGSEEDDLILDSDDKSIYGVFDEFYATRKDSIYLSQNNSPFVFISIKDLVCELMDLYDELENFQEQGISQLAKNFNLFVLYDNKMNMLRKVLYRLNMLDVKIDLSKLKTSDLESLNLSERWTLYNHWSSEFFKTCEEKIEELFDSHDCLYVDYILQRDKNDGNNIRAAGVEVVGATTTGAARLNKLVSSLKPKIVIIEEAAEILEAHTVASLSEHCEHLILIGDHKQLKPSQANFCSAEKLQMDVSLFERMILNRMEYFSLTEQHRMRPEISALITPYFYKNLTNHPCVEKYADLKGLKKNLFFLDHRVSEDKLIDNDSHKNEFEAEFILCLASYIIQQGYDKSKVTVLTFYGAQLLYMKSILFRFPLLEEVKLEVVDNFQGEENDIILLSLVRSNSHTVGFLAKHNRVCVALSRAKIGFILIGNMDTLQVNSEVWKDMKANLTKSYSIDSVLPLKCQTHRKITRVNKPADFHSLLNGGCTEECGIRLPCGHTCKYLCHPSDIDHVKSFKCIQPCLRKSTCNIHQCTAECGEECPPCNEKIPVILMCGHNGSRTCSGDILTCSLPCSVTLLCGHHCPNNCHLNKDTDHSKIKCKAICNKTLETCAFHHKCPKLCGEECGECTYDNLIERPCGHIIKGKCSEISKSECKVIIKKELLCGHVMNAECHTPLKKVLCTAYKNMILDCSHEVEAICGMEKKYIKCDVTVKKLLPCSHWKDVLCSNPVENILCDELVTKNLSCGHRFENAICSKSINELSCGYKGTKVFDCGHEMLVKCGEKNPKCIKDVNVIDSCGHSRKVPCFLTSDLSAENLMACENVCCKILTCKHKCMGTCGSCMQGRVHVACDAICGELMICGHKCTVKCWNDFHSCKNKCINSCEHKSCKRNCGEICDICVEPCSWSCTHFKCTKKCWEICDRQQCTFPCPLSLPCKHPCFGLCGDPCPPLCFFCSPQEKLDISDRYILLVECEHILSMKKLSALIKESVGLVRCPECRSPIIRTNFVKLHTKWFFSKYSTIRKSASELYNNKSLILHDFSVNFRTLNDILKKKYEGCDSLNKLLFHLLKATIFQQKNTRVSKLDLKTLLFICFYVTDVLQITQIDGMLSKNVTKLLNKIDHLASYLLKRAKDKISPQEMYQFSQELARLKCILDLMILGQELINDDAMYYYKRVKKIAFSLDEFTNQNYLQAVSALTILKKLTLSNHQLLSNEKASSDKIMNFLNNYFVISFHSDKWLKCTSGHSYFKQEFIENKCPLCSNKKKNSLFFI